MYCETCGRRLKDGDEFCPACGTKRSVEDEKGKKSRYILKKAAGVVCAAATAVVGIVAAAAMQEMSGVIQKKAGKAVNQGLKKVGLKKKTPVDRLKMMMKNKRKK